MHDLKKESDLERIKENSKAICYHLLVYSFKKIHSFIHLFVYNITDSQGAHLIPLVQKMARQ